MADQTFSVFEEMKPKGQKMKRVFAFYGEVPASILECGVSQLDLVLTGS